MANQMIRIRLKAYDHEVIDNSARKIVDTVVRTGATVAGPVLTLLCDQIPITLLFAP